MRGRFSLVFTLGLVLGSQLFGAVPQFTAVPPAVVDVRLQDSSVFTVQATDPDNHQLAYSWQIVYDPTGVAYNTGSTTARNATFAFPWVNNGVGVQPIGEDVRLRVTVAHANPAWDGQASASYEFRARILGVNQPPIPSITGFFGTPEAPLRPGDAIVCDAGDSIDPDSNGFRAEWVIG